MSQSELCSWKWWCVDQMPQNMVSVSRDFLPRQPFQAKAMIHSGDGKLLHLILAPLGDQTYSSQQLQLPPESTRGNRCFEKQATCVEEASRLH